jgi:hypothetical protein
MHNKAGEALHKQYHKLKSNPQAWAKTVFYQPATAFVKSMEIENDELYKSTSQAPSKCSIFKTRSSESS